MKKIVRFYRMKKIFACDQFVSGEDGEASLADVMPEEYLKKMLSCIDGGVLCIAKEEDGVSCNLAQDVSSADVVVKYTLDVSKIDADTIIARERALFAACREIADKKEGKKKTLAALQAAVGENIDGKGIRAANVLNRAQRLEKMLELGAPDFVTAAERCSLIEELALNAFAVCRKEIGREGFLQAEGVRHGRA